MTSSRVIRLCAGLDLVITTLFALPFISAQVLTLLFSINSWLTDAHSVPVFDPIHLLFVNIMGTLGVVWALARLAFPRDKFGWIDAWARLWVCVLLISYLVQPGVPVILSLFIATELIGAWAQFWILRLPD